MAAPPIANDSGMPMISPYPVVYVSEEFYDIAKIAETITWTYSIVLAIAVWDWLVSLRVEYDRIWKRKISVISVFYIGARYYCLADLAFLTYMYVPEVHSWDYCQKWFRWSAGLTVPTEIFAGGILLIRTWAFTGRKLYYLIIFVILYLVQIVYMLVITARALELVPWLREGQTRGKCITAGYSGDQLATGFWVAPLGFTVCLTAVTFVESIRIQKRLPASRRSPLFRVFLRDGLVYFIVVSCTNIANVAFFVQTNTSLKGSAMAFQFLLASLMSCRLVLSLRDSESLAMNSAAASLATKSFWKTGNAGGAADGSITLQNTIEDGNDSKADGFGSSRMKAGDPEMGKSLDDIPMGHQQSHPTHYVDPIAVQVHTDSVTYTSEKNSVKNDPVLRF